MSGLVTPEATAVRAAAGYDFTEDFQFEQSVSRGQALNNNAPSSVTRLCFLPPIPAVLESGVSAYLCTRFGVYDSRLLSVACCETINMGSLNLATNVFTAGSAMPTRTVLGSSYQLPGIVLCEVSAALNATPGNLTVTYKNQVGTAGQSTGLMTIKPSAPVYACTALTPAFGDIGAVQITAAVQSGGTTPSGTLQFWGLIAVGEQPGAPGGTALNENLLNAGRVVRLAASAPLSVWNMGSSSAGAGLGYFSWVGDT